ncbi:MAG: hypothetical protein AABX11_06290 [Nanoarchaeota archaeon]
MASITFAVDDELNAEISNFSWINLSEIVRKEIIWRLLLISQLNSKEEKELMSWSVELGRKAKKGRFQKLLSEISLKNKEKLMKKLHK